MRRTLLAVLAGWLSACSGSSFDIGNASVDASTSDTSSDTAPPPDAPAPDAMTVPDGAVADAGPACPAPPTTATYDPTSLACDGLLAQYPMKVADAKKCSCDADCRITVPRDFCGCTTFVNPGRESYAALDPMRDWWTKKGCTTPCVDFACPPATSARCVLGSSGGTCVDN